MRTPVIGRKNYDGSREPWSGHLAAMVWTFWATALQNHPDPMTDPRDYLHAYAANGHQLLSEAAIAAFLPPKSPGSTVPSASAPAQSPNRSRDPSPDGGVLRYGRRGFPIFGVQCPAGCAGVHSPSRWAKPSSATAQPSGYSVTRSPMIGQARIDGKPLEKIILLEPDHPS